MTIEELRRQIDKLDGELAWRLSARVLCVAEIQRLKRLKGLNTGDLQRETEILATILKGKGVLEAAYLTAVYKSLFEFGRKL